MSEPELSFLIDGPVARATIKRPHAMNAMKNGMWEAMADHLRSI